MSLRALLPGTLFLLAALPALAQPEGSGLDLPLGPAASRELPGGSGKDPVDPVDEPPVLFGTPIEGARESILFVIDLSGSMSWDEQSYVDPRTNQRQRGSRLDRAKAELSKTIDSLPERLDFEVVAFNCGRRFCFGQLTAASADHKATALTWVAGLVASGGTGTGPAVVAGLALCVPQETVLVLLTDGAPNCGGDGLEGHRRQIRIHDAGRNRIDVIGIAASGDYRAFCQAVASDNQGTFTDVP